MLCSAKHPLFKKKTLVGSLVAKGVKCKALTRIMF
jgi:hypothetical protein